MEVLNVFKSWYSYCHPTFNGDCEYEVVGTKGWFVVNLRARTCTCGRWQLCGIPCANAISCILYTRENLVTLSISFFELTSVCKCMPSRSIPLTVQVNGWRMVMIQRYVHHDFPPTKKGLKQTKRRKEACELERKKWIRVEKRVCCHFEEGSNCKVCHMQTSWPQ
ncbi:hypothetical protein LINPERHAP2_LOCUS33300 [Linum perenne]